MAHGGPNKREPKATDPATLRSSQPVPADEQNAGGTENERQPEANMTRLSGAPFPEIINAAWNELGDRRRILALQEISANVSTNNVYRVQLSDGHELVAKTSNYGSYVHFRQDHRLIRQWGHLLGGTRFANFLAPIVLKGHEVFTYREAQAWAVFYEKAPFYDFLPRILTEPQIDALAREMAEFHLASAAAAPQLNPTWKTLGSDIAALFDLLGNPHWRNERGFDDSVEDSMRRQCETFLDNAEKLGYHQLPKIPVLVDWNIGNFSVGFDRDGFKFFTRWDYDWFRVEPKVLDFYFCARVVRAEGDKTAFSYTTEPFFDPRFMRFLRTYHSYNPLSENELLFLKEAFRFFVLNYVVRSGEHFFRPAYCSRLQREAVELFLPNLDPIDFSPLLDALR